jgi:citrate synthase
MGAIPKGLEGVEVDCTAVSLVDGEAGKLSYRGRDVTQLIDWPFSRAVLLVVDGEEPTDAKQRAFEAALADAARLSQSDCDLLRVAARTDAHPMSVLQGLVPLLSRTDHFSDYGAAAHGFTVAAKLPSLIAGLHRLRSDGTLPPTVDALDPNARFLAEMGITSNPLLARAFNVTQILQIEHGFNASTFTARVVASTLANVENAIAAALGALHGPLHGGADQAALEMALEVGAAAKAADFVDACLSNGRKIMGMGHREYRVLDPRARFVKALAAELAAGTPLESTYETLEAIEAQFRARMLERGKSLYANLEFYKGIVYRAAGLPADYFTAAFAMARVYGYLAHFIESRIDNRIIRPAARYVGVIPA